MTALQLAAGLNFLGAALHLAVIPWGPNGYRALGTGERMAQWAAHKPLIPALLTLLITGVLASWGLYCLAQNGSIPALPWSREIVIAITGLYIVRGIYPLLLSPLVALFRTPFMRWSSLACLGIGGVHLLGIWPLLHA